MSKDQHKIISRLSGIDDRYIASALGKDIDLSESGLAHDEPMVLYPHRTPLWKRAVPAVAAAAALGIAIPVGVNVLGNRTEIASPAASAEETKGEEAYITAFRQYFEDLLDDSRMDHLNENIMRSVNTEELAKYYKPLELEASDNGVTVKLHGLLDGGHGALYAYCDIETDREVSWIELETYVPDIKVYDEYIANVGSGCCYGAIGETFTSFSGIIEITPLPIYVPQSDLEKLDSVKLLVYIDDEVQSIAYEAAKDYGAEFDIPINFAETPSISASSAVYEWNCDMTLTPFNCMVTMDIPREVYAPGGHYGNAFFADFDVLKVVMKDGSTVYYNDYAKGYATDGDELYRALFPLRAPIDLDEVAKVELGRVYALDNIEYSVIYEAEKAAEPDASEPAAEVTDEDILKALSEYYCYWENDPQLAEYPDKPLVSGVMLDNILDYYKPFNLTAENNGLKIDLHGVIDMGYGSILAVYSYESEEEVDRISIETYIYYGSFGNHYNVGVCCDDALRPAGSGIKITPVIKAPLSGEEYSSTILQAANSIKLAFRSDDGETVAEGSERERLANCFTCFDIPFSFNALPELGGNTTISGAKAAWTATPFFISFDIDREEPVPGKIKVTMKDGRVCGTNIKYSFSEYDGIKEADLFTSPLDPAEIAKIEYVDVGEGYIADNGTIIYEAE